MKTLKDPQMAAGVAMFQQVFPDGLNLDDIAGTRQYLDQVMAAGAASMPPMSGVESQDHYAPGLNGAPDVMVRVYQPENCPEESPALLWIHGGGFVLGSVAGDDLKAKALALSLNCVVASVEYRLAPEHPFPAPMDDCYAALQWLASKTEQFKLNPQRIAIGGASAGAGLAAGLALMARDRGEIDVCYQLLIYPMLDDTNLEQASDAVPDTYVWSRKNNLIGWRSYLGQEPGGDDVSIYAAPLRAEDLSGLPPAFIGVGTPDLFLDEDITYARRLIQADVSTELHIYADAFHGFEGFAADADASKRFVAEYTAHMARALHG